MKEISASEAHELMSADPSIAYLDVRSRAEFLAGRPKGALHAALLERGASGRMEPNPDFLGRVKNLLAPETTLICGCQMGGRSARAVRLLEEAGFSDVMNMRGGYGGARDPQTGQVLEPGWSQLGFPSEVG